MPSMKKAKSHRLQQWLDENEKTQGWLAQRVGVHFTAISLIVNRQRNPSPQLALKIEKATGRAVLVTELLYPDGYP